MTGGRRTHIRVPFVGRMITPVGDEFVSTEALGGVVLLLASIAALVWVNGSFDDSYADVWGYELTVGIGNFSISEDLQHWVNDGLMTVFFFVVALEIKRELVHGDLRDPRRAALPALAALGGMVVPALLYLAWNPGAPGADGWGIPMATDLAFALGVLALVSARVPAPLKLFLLTLAIVDDVGAILVIAVFYSDSIASAGSAVPSSRWVPCSSCAGCGSHTRSSTSRPRSSSGCARSSRACTRRSRASPSGCWRRRATSKDAR